VFFFNKKGCHCKVNIALLSGRNFHQVAGSRLLTEVKGAQKFLFFHPLSSHQSRQARVECKGVRRKKKSKVLPVRANKWIFCAIYSINLSHAIFIFLR
jgi:hypothetical protein